jgi:uncharacterized protein YkwD
MVLRLAFTALMAVTLAAVLGATAVKPGGTGAADTVSVRGCTSTEVALSAVEKRMLDLHNQKRVSQKLSAFCVHPALQRAARAHSWEMIGKDYFSHGSRSGKNSRFA